MQIMKQLLKLQERLQPTLMLLIQQLSNYLRLNNPISAKQVTGLGMQIVSTSSDTALIATKSSLTMQVTTAKSVTAMNIAFQSPTNIGVLTADANQFTVITIRPGVFIEQACRASLKFPTEITYQSTVFLSGTVTDATYNSGTTTLESTEDAQCNKNIDETTDMIWYVRAQGPPQVKDTSNFEFTLTTSTGDAIATGTAYVLSTSITPGEITNFIFTHVTGASTIVQATTEWRMGFTLGNPLANPWKILVTYPNTEFTVSACTVANANGFTNGAATTCEISANTITLLGAYTINAGAVYIEGLTGTNPTAVFDTSAFTANSFNTIGVDDFPVDQQKSGDASFTNPFQASAQT
jgi:hypothetical protein